MSAPEANPPPKPMWPWALAGIWGAVAGLLSMDALRSAGGAGVGMLSLWAAPVFLGVVAALCYPERPIRHAIGLGVLTMAAATPLLGEGALCLIMIAPWTLGVVVLVSGGLGWILRQRAASVAEKALLLGLVWAGGLAAPGLDARFTDPNLRESFEDSVVIDAPVEEVWASIADLQMDFHTPAPWVVAALLPRPTGIRGGGAALGDVRRALFDNGVLLTRVTASEAPYRFEIDIEVERSGREFFDHYCALEHAWFELSPLDGGRTRVSHRTTYRPRAWPRWYFAPMERALGSEVQAYMLDAYAAEVQPALVRR